MSVQSHTAKEAEKLLFIHPHKLVLYFILAAITMAFLAVCGAYVYTRVEQGVPPVKLPWIFLFNTVFLVVSALLLKKSVKALDDDRANKLLRLLSASLLLTIVFAIAQIIGWQQMVQLNLSLTGPDGPGTGYLYAISALHLIHVLGGIPFLAAFIVNTHKKVQNPVSELIFLANPLTGMYLRMLVLYWRFLDILWIVLILFFGINQLVH